MLSPTSTWAASDDDAAPSGDIAVVAPRSTTANDAASLPPRPPGAVTSLSDNLQGSANLMVMDGRGGMGFPLAIRGVRPQPLAAGLAPSVPVYVDGVSQGFDSGARADFVGISGIEVAMGPNGGDLLHDGLAGAVRITTRVPSTERAFEASLSAATRDEVKGSLYGDLPLGDGGSAVDMAVYGVRRDGIGRNFVTGHGIDDLAEGGFRIGALVPVGASSHIRLGWQWSREADAAPATRLIDLPSGPLAAAGLNLAGIVPASTLQIGEQDIAQNIDPHETVTSEQAFASFDRIGTAITIHAQTSWRGFNNAWIGDGDGSPADLLTIGSDSRMRRLAQEVHIASVPGKPLSWQVAGAWSRETDGDGDDLIWSPMLLAYEGMIYRFAPYATAQTLGARSSVTHERWLLGGRFDAKLTDTLTLSGWLRWQHESQAISLDQTSFAPAVAYLNVPVIADYQDRQSFSALEPGTALAIAATDHLALRFSVAKGYKPGGFSQSITIGQPGGHGALAYGGETLWNGEGSIDWTPSRRFTAGVTGFVARWLGRQISEAFVAQSLDAGRVLNCCDLKGWGLEGRLAASPDPRLTVSFQGGYNAWTVTTSQEADFAPGSAYSEAPRWTASARLHLERPLARLPVSFDIGATGQGAYDLAMGGNQTYRQGVQVRLNAGADIALTAKMTLTLFADNLTDVSSLAAVDQSLAQIPWLGVVKAYAAQMPRTVGLRLTFRKGG